MKKMISMMLMLCAIFTFSACSSDDDDPVNPLTGVVIPQSAQIGSVMTIQGTGFAAGQVIQLTLADAEPVEVEAKYSANGATFTVPYTLSTGTASVVLKVGNNNWPLGSVMLTAPANPISAFSLPSELAFNSNMELNGIGFQKGDLLKFDRIDLDAQKMRSIELASNYAMVTSTDSTTLSVTIPTLEDGNYDVSLIRGKNTWSLGTSYIYQPKRIKSIYYENPFLMYVIGKESFTMNFSYNENGTLAAIESPEDLSYQFVYDDSLIITTSVMNMKPLKFTVKDGKIVKSTAFKAEEEYPKTMYNYWSYNNDNTLASVKNKDKDYDGAELLEVKNENNNVSAFSLSRVSESSFDASLELHAVPGTIDVRYLLNAIIYMMQGEDIFVGMLLNNNVKTSSYLPTIQHIGYQDFNDLEEKVADVNLNTSFFNNTLTIDFLNFHDLEQYGTFGSKVQVVYENK